MFEQSTIQRGTSGSLFVSSTFLPGVSRRFGADGSLVASFGRSGEGPGEFQLPAFVFEEDDRKVVFDALYPRATSLSRELRAEETRTLPFPPFSVAHVSRGRYVLAAVSWLPDYVGLPLHLFDFESGKIIHSFGGNPRDHVLRSDAPLLRRLLAPGRDGSVWSAAVNEYRVEQWDESGNLLGAFVRSTPWFPPPSERSRQPARIERPTPHLRGLVEDERGRLWVLIHTASEGWEPLPPAGEVSGMTFTSDEQMDRLHDTVIEVLEFEGGTARLLASVRFSRRMIGFVSTDAPEIYAYSEDAEGNPQYALIRLSLRDH